MLLLIEYKPTINYGFNFFRKIWFLYAIDFFEYPMKSIF